MKFDWDNSHKLSSVDELKKVKTEEGPDIVLWGSSTLYPQLLDANLIDYYYCSLVRSFLEKGSARCFLATHPADLHATDFL